jgi:hypothetical protein
MPDLLLWIALTIRMTPIIFGFSWGGPIGLRKPQLLGVGKAWISLDSFVRIETSQWVTRDSAKNFSPAPARPRSRNARAVEVIRKGGIVHGTSLTRFLIVSNQLSSDPARKRRATIGDELRRHCRSGEQGLKERPWQAGKGSRK